MSEFPNQPVPLREQVPTTADPAACARLGPRIRIHPELSIADYFGTAAELVAEGLIPDGLSWPEKSDSRRWTSGRNRFWLRRERPEGHKGPQRSWQELDHWFLRVEVIDAGYEWAVRRRLQLKAAELAADYYKLTQEGWAKGNELNRRYWASVADKRFQAFKSLIPGLTRPKRARKVDVNAGGANEQAI